MKYLLATVIFAACAKTEYSAELSEPATVVEVVYSPSQHGSGTGMSMKGELSVTSVSIPEVFATVFECQHGKFIIERKDVWQRSHVGDRVNVRYREVYKVRKGQRELVNYDFISVEKI
jgi:hypothetical protein